MWRGTDLETISPMLLHWMFNVSKVVVSFKRNQSVKKTVAVTVAGKVLFAVFRHFVPFRLD